MDIPIKDLLTPNIATMISTFLMLVFTYFLFKKYLFAPTRNFLTQRQKYITKNIKDAERSANDASGKLLEAQKHLEKTTEDSTKYLEKQMDIANDKANKLLENAKSNIESLRESTKTSLKNAEAKARKNLREEVTTLSIEVAKKVLDKEVDEKSSKKLVDNFIKGIK